MKSENTLISFPLINLALNWQIFKYIFLISQLVPLAQFLAAIWIPMVWLSWQRANKGPTPTAKVYNWLFVYLRKSLAGEILLIFQMLFPPDSKNPGPDFQNFRHQSTAITDINDWYFSREKKTTFGSRFGCLHVGYIYKFV